MSEARRRELGETDAPVEDSLIHSFNRMVQEGAERIARTFRAMLVTGFLGGVDVAMGVIAYLAVLHETGNQLLAGLAFSIGLIALLMSKSELFTEDFLVPITAVASRMGSLRQLAKLWGGTLFANLLGGWIIMWFVMQAFPEWEGTITKSADHFIGAPFNLQTMCLAILGGSTITLMTRMQHGTDSEPAKIVAAVVGGFLLAGLQLFHSILDSLLIFGAIQAGADITYLQWLGWFGYTLLFNILGGLMLVTSLRVIRTFELIQQRRRESHPNPDASHDENY
ncbi:formate/nitrite transporter family protein [Arthrobacter pigmenti]